MTEPHRRSGRLQLLLIAAVFAVPLIVAAWLYFAGAAFAPEGRANHGLLLEPVVSIEDALPAEALAPGQWLLVYSHASPCGDACREALHTTRQLRLMLGAEMHRVTRVFLHGATPPDTVFTANEHEGLVTLEDENLRALLAERHPASAPGGGYYLVDPLGNLVMYFPPSLAPRDIVADIKRLLRLSHIG
jgi:hypothetical protein